MTDCVHEGHTEDGRMFICKKCGVGSRTPFTGGELPTGDPTVVLEQSVYIGGLTVTGDIESPEWDVRLELAAANAHKRPMTLHLPRLPAGIARALQEGGPMHTPWKMLLVRDTEPDDLERGELAMATVNATAMLDKWLADCSATLSTGQPVSLVERARGEQMLRHARSAWLRAVFAECNVHALSELREAMRKVRAEVLHAEAAARLLAEEGDERQD